MFAGPDLLKKKKQETVRIVRRLQREQTKYQSSYPAEARSEKLFCFALPSFKHGGRFGYFLFFLLGGAERGSPRRREGGGGTDFFLKIPGREGVLPGRWGQGGEGPGGCLQGISGEGLNIFFRGRNSHQVSVVKLGVKFSGGCVNQGKISQNPRVS